MKINVDHAGICAYQLEPVQKAFASVGLETLYGGAHATGGTHNALLGFDDGSYLELIAPQHPESMSKADARDYEALKPDRAQTCFWATGTTNIPNAVQTLRQHGFDIQSPQLGSRKRPDGILVVWDTAAIDQKGGGDILPFFIEDRSRRSTRIQPSPSVTGSELRGIEWVVLGVKDLDASIALVRKAYGWPAPTLATDASFGARMAYFAGTPVLLAAPLDKSSWLTGQLEKSGQGPIGLLIGTKDFASSTKRFKLSGDASWFGRKVAWFDAEKLHGARLGVVE
ncbi:MAG: VOC family protein [Acidobacteriia bacterium]|nr:VOC family protein [Terriglobia bacterium]